MANIVESLKLVFRAEFSDSPDKFLHKNEGEDGWTLGGVYQKANPFDIDWKLVDWIVDKVGAKRASRMLYYDTTVMGEVVTTYKIKYWDALKLDRVDSQKKADEMFLMAIVSGVKNSAKITQRLVGVSPDGIIGEISLNAINNFPEREFDRRFDQSELEYFENLVRANSKYEKFLKGWINRSAIA